MIGRTGVELPALGLGTAPLGGLFAEVSEATAVATIERAVARGAPYLDTAPLYGFGAAERRIGRALAGRDADDVVLSTKVGRLVRPGAPPDPSQFDGGEPIYAGAGGRGAVRDYSGSGILASLEESLARLGRDRVDIVHVHDPDDHVEQVLAESLPALRELRADGLLRAIGVGMNQCAALCAFVERDAVDCVLVAGRYSLLDQAAFDRLLPLCAERGVAVIVGGVFNSGVLADPSPGARFDYRRAPRAVLVRACAIAATCARHGVPLRAAALAFPRGHPAVASVLVGARSPAELDDALRMAAHPIPAVLWEDLRRQGLLRADVPVPSA